MLFENLRTTHDPAPDRAPRFIFALGAGPATRAAPVEAWGFSPSKRREHSELTAAQVHPQRVFEFLPASYKLQLKRAHYSPITTHKSRVSNRHCGD